MCAKPAEADPAEPHPVITIRVDLGQQTYPIHIGNGLLAGADSLLESVLDKPSKIVVVADAALTAMLPPLVASLARLADTHTISLTSGEAAKSFVRYQALMEEILQHGIDRSSVLVAFGGGVIGDLVGFVAATALRGIDLIHIPTTLLAQADSAIGGKTGINTASGKNLVGAFHQPRAVISDTETLATLPPREMRAGYAEVVKYGLLGDGEFFTWCEKNGEAVLAGDAIAIHHAISHAAAMKAAIVAEDEYESGRRSLLNLGHSFAHAFEAESGYDGSVLHGEAVAAGMMCAFALSTRLGFIAGEAGLRVSKHLAQVGLPSWHSDLPTNSAKPDRLINHMRADKKARGGQLAFVLVRDIGDAFLARHIDPTQVAAVLAAKTFNAAIA